MRFRLSQRYGDFDTKGHVNNAVYLTYFEVARERAWLEVVRGDADVPWILAEAAVRYVSPALLGDPLDVEITTAEVRNRSWTWRYRLLDARDGRLVAEGHTVQVMYDYAARRAIAVPDALRARLLEV